ncbi:FG-GAP-like repeat-containing protein [Streptomyces noboritoensis]|uniref:FG-GAP-like repeat-containing protein n=1 Tax=Streptomyces noboritoensis TaxID=67337 RepID=A0ABV6TQK3_9ACTN
MTSRARRMPGRKATAAMAAAVVVASGVTYIGLNDSGGSHKKPRSTENAAPLDEAGAAAKAKRTGKAVEAAALRTAYSTTWARPDGMLQRRIHASPIRAKVGGEWKAIDPTLIKVSNGWSPKATNVRMTFSAGASGSGTERASRDRARRVPLLAPAAPNAATATGNTLVTLSTGGHDIALTWPGPIPQPVIDGSRALYPEILPGADLVLTADDGGFAQLLVVKSRQAAANPQVARLAYGLSSPDLNFSLDPTTRILTAKDSGGDDVAESPTPLMWDSAGAPASTDSGGGGTGTPPPPEPTPTDTPDGSASGGETPTASPQPSGAGDDTDRGDVWKEVLPGPSDDAPDPSIVRPNLTPPPIPPEASPEPTRTGPDATLGLAALSGPQPASHGALADVDLQGSDWVLTADQDFLNDSSTVYPVFIDPSVKKHTNDWTTAYDRHPNANFYNGRNFNKGGTHEARVGFESDTWGTSRSFFTIDWDDDLKDAIVSDATLRILETYSWSCDARRMDIYLTGQISSRTTWNTAPKMTSGNKLASRSFAHGWKSGSCPDDYEAFKITPTAQRAVTNGWKTLTIGLRAATEDSQYAWKKIQADGGNDPYVDLSYNRRPEPPTGLDLDPDLSCDTTAPYVNVGASQLTFWAGAKDRDDNLASLRFQLWKAGTSPTNNNLLGNKGNVSVGSQTSSARVHTDPFSTSGLQSGTTYSWRVIAVDKYGATSSRYSPADIPCRFVFDNQRPSPPIVTSTDFPDADQSDNGFWNEPEDSVWSTKKFGEEGSFTFRTAQSDVTKFEYSYNGGAYNFSVSRTAGSPTTVASKAKPPMAGPVVLYVRAVDAANNRSEPRKYLFYVTPRDSADSPGDLTGDKLPDLMVVSGDGDLRTYPSQALADLSKGTGGLGYSMSGGYRGNPDKDPNGSDGRPIYTAAPSGYWKNTLVAHLGDVYGGDGLQDLVAVREGKLWVYPGDGYGAVNIDKRQEILLPSNAPSPASITQIVSAGDATGDGKPDFFLRVGDAFWALVGYNGATVDQAVQLSPDAWSSRDIVTVQDVTGDGTADLIYRNDSAGQLALRVGKKATTGGVDLKSLASAAGSANGSDGVYGASSWGRSNIRLLYGTPDADGDGIPDIWVIKADGTVRFYSGGRTTMPTAGIQINSGWQSKLAIG